MEVRKPFWTEWSFLLYAGALTVLAAALAALSYLSDHYGKGAYVLWSLLPLAVLAAVARAFRSRGEWIAAGLFAVAATAMWAAFLAALESWWGWVPNDQRSPFDGWHWGIWLLLLLVIARSVAALRAYRFPLLMVFPLLSAYYLVTDVLSGGGSWSAVVTLAVGLVYLAIGVGVDGGPRTPFGFWLHLIAGLLVGGALLYWWHSSETDYALLATAGVVFVRISARTRRSSWAVLGVAGFLVSTVHWVSDWSSAFSIFTPTRDWVPPLVYGVVGFFFVLLGLLVERRRQPA
jgi:hypothetical protein